MQKLKPLAVPATIFLILIGGAQSASAADWVGLGKDVKGRTWFIGRDSIQAESGIVSVWAKMECPEKAEASETERMPRPAADLFQTDYSLLLLEFDFSDKSYRQVALYGYVSDGRQLESNVIPSGWEYIVPNTVAETVYLALKEWLNW